jgi:Lrp/AsnC family transcriptional regulator for asnA, asnC and gidA
VDPLSPLDALDRSILAALQLDGRRPFRVIARDLDVSEGTVRTRVRKLEESGVLRILAFVDPLKLGDALIAVLNVQVSSGSHEDVATQISSWDEVSYVSSVLGPYDLSIQAMTASVAGLWELARRIEHAPTRLGHTDGVRVRIDDVFELEIKGAAEAVHSCSLVTDG